MGNISSTSSSDKYNYSQPITITTELHTSGDKIDNNEQNYSFYYSDLCYMNKYLAYKSLIRVDPNIRFNFETIKHYIMDICGN